MEVYSSLHEEICGFTSSRSGACDDRKERIRRVSGLQEPRSEAGARDCGVRYEGPENLAAPY
jgi:hypothetical protein